MLASTTGLALDADELMLLNRLMSSERALATFLAIASAAALFLVLMLDGAVAEAQSAPTPILVAAGSVIVWETAIPEDWPQGQASHIIMTLEAYSPDDAPLSFTLDDTPDAAKFSLIPAGMNEAGNYTAHLVLKEGEELDYETQDTYLIGVEVTTGAGDKTELLIRLRIIDVDEAIPSPEPTPTAPCFEAISGNVNIVRSWDSSCLSENRPNDTGAGDYYARFFTFTLSEAATISVNLNSDVDTYLYLMKGAEKAGEVIAENDDTIRYTDTNSTIQSQELGAGEYTIETTAYDTEKSGNFRLVVRGLPDTGKPAADCSTGGAVSGADENPKLVEDCETLLSLRDALAGAVLLNWATDTPITDWDRVTVGGSPMRVTELALEESGLTGRIPAALASLAALERLSLSGNSLKGEIPGELGNLAELKELALDGNRLTGSMPARLGALENLETLALNNNQLSGAIPAELGDLSELRSLTLSDNRLTGEIPVELGELSNLAVLKLADNSLSGCFAPALQDVADNDLSETGLEGCASGVCATGAAVDDPNDNLGLVADCNALLAARSRLAGGAPLNWSVDLPIEEWEGVNVGGSPKRVIHLVLTQETLTNRLTGRLSAELGKLSHLTLLQITGNEIDGAIPPELGRLSRLHFLILTDNELEGSIPPELDGLSGVSHIYLAGNELSGEIPPELSSLTNLMSVHLSDNRLSGEVPGELGSLPNLRLLYLDDNDLSGDLPAGLGDSRSLEVLSIDRNRLTGSIPAELGSIDSLEILSLASNDLTGEIPAQLAAIPNLRILELYGNRFTGCVPKELRDVLRNDLDFRRLRFCDEGQCHAGDAVPDPIEDYGLVSDCNVLLSALDDLTGDASLNWSTELPLDQWEGVEIDDSLNRVTALNLSAKGLDGNVPPELANLTHLKVLSLSANELTGTIPSELVKLSQLEVLSLDDNRLVGEIPHELTRPAKLEKLLLSGNWLTGCIPDGLKDVQENDFGDTGLMFCGVVDCSSGGAIEDPEDNAELVSDCEALLGMRDALAGATFLNWSVNVAVDDWDGITVGGSTKRVTHIELADKALTGVVPRELGELTGLEVLSLSANNLTGEIPSELGTLSGLKLLLLEDNHLTGSISPELGVLGSLEELKLSGNSLTGCIPRKWMSIPTNDLDELGLGFCVPGECSIGSAVEDPDANPGLVADCDVLLASMNALRGDGILVWSANRPIEEWYGVTVSGSPKRVTRLEIGPSRFNGEIPAELSELSNLEVLWLNNNRLSGEIPAELGELSMLKLLSLSGNMLNGEIPVSLGALAALERLSLSDNLLTGSIPSELGNLSRLEYLSLTDNDLSGAIPSTLGSPKGLETLYLSQNRLSGEIPLEIGDLTNLNHLHLSDNGLTGAVPAELGNLSRLTHLHLSRNELSGSIPAELGNLANLRYLHLSDNDLSGKIPAKLGDLSSLIELYLSRNALTGAIPAELGNLPNLVQLYLPRNQLTGEIPAELADLTNLVHLFLGGNQLSGCIPAGLEDVRNNDVSLLNLPYCEVDN